MMTDTIKDQLKIIHHSWLLPNLFSFIWNMLKSEPTDENAGLPEWPLKLALQSYIKEEEEYTEKLNEKLCVKHAVELFKHVTKAVYEP